MTGITALIIQKEFDDEHKRRTPDYALIELIKLLRANYKTALLTNTGEEEIDIIYRDNISDLFDVKTLSYRLKLVKPSEKIYLKCLEELGTTPSETILVDDSKTNLEGARKVVIKTILYKDFGVIPRTLNILASAKR